jgi:hypothetical protein
MRYEGYHDIGELPIKAGDRVTLPKGTLVMTTNPKHDGIRVLKRKCTVTVHHVGHGSNAYVNRGEKIPVSNPEVFWADTSGYWCRVDINTVLAKSA